MKKPVNMAWNEPGGSNNGSNGSKDKDPWGNRNNQQGPPDLDEIVRKLQEKLGAIFGGGKGKGSGGSGGGVGKAGSIGISLIALVVAVLWGLSGFYIVNEGKRGVVLQFGEYNTTTQAGLRWHIPFPVEAVHIIDVSQIRTVEIGYRTAGRDQVTTSVPQEALMLTQDENIIDINFAIQYRIKDAKNYLFNVKDPDVTLGQATESAVRETIGKSKMDFVLTEGRTDIVTSVELLTQNILDRYESGLIITSVNMQDAQPPDQVQAAFSDAVKAREDNQKVQNEAEAYANDVRPKAEGSASRILAEADAYKEKVIAQADGETSRFLAILKEYEDAPEVTRERLYLDAMEEVLGNTSKVMLDVDKGGNLLFLPLDRIFQGTGDANTLSSSSSTNSTAGTQQFNQRTQNNMQDFGQRPRATTRTREVR